MFGQVQHTLGERSARLTYLLPESASLSPAMVELVEGLSTIAGQMSAFNLLAEVDENAAVFESLRTAGFSVYGWQRIWKMQLPAPEQKQHGGHWQPAVVKDEIPIRSLFQSLVPPLVQAAEPLTSRRPDGLVYRNEGELLAYVEVMSGPRGIYLHPLIHPAAEDVENLLKNLAKNLYSSMHRPVYLAVRSYQAWLETALEQLEASCTPRQALMIKRLSIVQRVEVLNPHLSAVEAHRVETSTPLLRFNDTLNKSKTKIG